LINSVVTNIHPYTNDLSINTFLKSREFVIEVILKTNRVQYTSICRYSFMYQYFYQLVYQRNILYFILWRDSASKRNFARRNKTALGPLRQTETWVEYISNKQKTKNKNEKMVKATGPFLSRQAPDRCTGWTPLSSALWREYNSTFLLKLFCNDKRYITD
jgi:hypothetical protein